MLTEQDFFNEQKRTNTSFYLENKCPFTKGAETTLFVNIQCLEGQGEAPAAKNAYSISLG